MSYQAPKLSEEDIQVAFQSGLFGDSMQSVTVDQLKSATPDLMTKLFTSILQQLEVNTDDLAHTNNENIEIPAGATPLLTRMRIVDVINQNVPDLNATLGEVLFPKWRITRNMLSTIVNYLRYYEMGSARWSAIVEKFEADENELKMLQAKVEEMERSEEDFASHMELHRDLYQQQRSELKELDEKWNVLMQKQQQKMKEKETVKQAYLDQVQKNEHAKEKLIQLQNIKKDLQNCIVSSPQRHLEEKQKILEKLEGVRAQNDQSNHNIRVKQEKLSEIKKLVDSMPYTLEQIEVVQSIVDDINHKEKSMLKEEGELKSLSMTRAMLTQQVDSLKTQIAAQHMKLHQQKVWQDRELAIMEQHLSDVKLSNEMKMKQKTTEQEQIEAFRADAQAVRREIERVEGKHKEAMDEIENKTNQVVQANQEIADKVKKIFERTVENTKLLKLH